MSREEAIDKYPALAGMSVIDLILLRHAAMESGDGEFRQAVDAFLKQEENVTTR